MRGADSSAGTIKSGGKTRRAAKMVVLNVDHPDVRDFIWCKAREEHKAARCATPGSTWTWTGATRTGSSTRTPTTRSGSPTTSCGLRGGRDYALRAVLDGSVIEEVAARDVMREIAQAAWECADPGMQYDTTINDWHTTPESGRINASTRASPGDRGFTPTRA